MKAFTVKNITYNLPQSWSECKLKQAIIVSDLEQHEDEFKVLALISGYSGIPIDDLKQSNISVVKDITEVMKFVLEPLPDVPLMEFDFNGKHFYTMESFLESQSQDFFTVEAILQNNANNTFKALPELLAVMCKQKDETLDDFNLAERAKEFEDLPMDIANGIRVFFYILELTYQTNSQSYLNRNQIVEQKAREVLNTLKQLDVTDWSGRLLQKTLRRYVLSLLKSWRTYSSGIR